jgi:hypothetical protein
VDFAYFKGLVRIVFNLKPLHFALIHSKAFFNTMDWWGIFPTRPLPLPHHWRKLPYLNLCCVWMFSMQFITNFSIKTLFWEARDFFKMCSQNAGNAISGPKLKIFPGGHAPSFNPPNQLVPAVLCSHIRRCKFFPLDNRTPHWWGPPRV